MYLCSSNELQSHCCCFSENRATLAATHCTPLTLLALSASDAQRGCQEWLRGLFLPDTVQSFSHDSVLIKGKLQHDTEFNIVGLIRYQLHVEKIILCAGVRV